jgi:hypothetical protein
MPRWIRGKSREDYLEQEEQKALNDDDLTFKKKKKKNSMKLPPFKQVT